VNQAWLDLAGLTRKEEVIGKTSLELEVIRDREQRDRILNEFRQHGSVRNAEVETSTRAGIRVLLVNLDWVEIGGRRFILSAMQDISERKRAEEALRETAEELARSNNDLEHFAHVASHDLQEPLRQVQAFVQILQERHADKLDDKAAQYMRFVVDGAARMSSLVQGLLEYSRVGAKDALRRPIACGQALDAAVANLQAAVAESRAAITHDDLPTVLAEPTQLTQLFQNLIGNAVKFRRDGVAPEIHVAARRDGDRWCLWVKDNGIGIDPRFQEKVFLIFQRLHTREKYPGTGIGLAICKKIVEQHGGRIWIESKAGEGSTFYFTLPDSSTP
jgi:PAS domain S-box-containing protein